ncbi:CHY_zinc finger domain-containing protein [Hexamita inflata]|uniref:CHY zinc finger domain-containing protein n=1 Tax=Hexamita inflata TaxID=28002 RepID=A0AA86TU81_9EUKA|nr:CHY zinc finger domain-containing protein [Hexamita inflata]
MCIYSFNISLTKCDCLMQPIAQQQADHSQEHCNEVMIAKIFKLEPGSRDKSDSDKQIVLRQFTFQTISDERKSYIDSEMKKIYHHMLLEYYDPTIPDYTCLSNFHAMAYSTIYTLSSINYSCVLTLINYFLFNIFSLEENVLLFAPSRIYLYNM